MTLKRKLKNQKGFSLAETLLAVMILLLVSVIVANGIPVARNVYNNVIIGSNAQVLLSTAVSALRNDLGTARDVKIMNGTDIVYYKASIQAYSKLSVDAAKGIQLTDYVNPDTGAAIPQAGGTARTPRNLVSASAANKNLIVTYATPAVDPDQPDILNIAQIEVKRKDDSGSVLASLDQLSIRFFPVNGSNP